MKFKQIPKDYYITILDRLTRFEPANIRYERVFGDLISKFCIDKISKDITLEEKIALIEELFKFNFGDCGDDFINKLLIEMENRYFKFDEVSYQYLSARLNYNSLLNGIKNNNDLPKNVFWLKNLEKNEDLISQRKKHSLLYPIEKIIICEGQTEFSLLSQIFKLFNYDLDKEGVIVFAAGGKNQVAKKYYKLIEYTKTPFFILLDKDAYQIQELIKPKLRKQDKIYLIQSGEFEDIIPLNILKNAINSEHSSEINCVWDDFSKSSSMVENLELIYKKYGFGEFKKAHFANILNNYIKNNAKSSDFENSEIIDILECLQK